jgi:hypothetical protein
MIKYIIYICILLLIFSSCGKEETIAENLIGKWNVDINVKHYEDEERSIFIDEINRLYEVEFLESGYGERKRCSLSQISCNIDSFLYDYNNRLSINTRFYYFSNKYRKDEFGNLDTLNSSWDFDTLMLDRFTIENISTSIQGETVLSYNNNREVWTKQE